MKDIAVCIMSTLLTGGTRRHYMEMTKVYSYRCTVLLVEYLLHLVKISWWKHGKLIEQEVLVGEDSWKFLAGYMSDNNIKLIHLHHVLWINDELRQLLLKNKYLLAITLHDYYTICPRTYMAFNNRYCGEEKSEEKCNKCLAVKDRNENIYFRQLLNEIKSMKYNSAIASWRHYFGELLTKANYIFVPSNDEKQRLLKYHPALRIRVVQNPEMILPNWMKQNQSIGINLKKKPERIHNNIVHIGILGSIFEIKGRSLLLAISRLAEKKQLKIRFVIFGTLASVPRKLPTNLTIMGSYQEKMVYQEIYKEKIDFFWFTGSIPETYSYVLTIPIRLGIPTIAADIGAIGERIKNGRWGTTYPVNATCEEVLQALQEFDFEQYKKIGDFTIKNDYFLSFKEMYGDIGLPNENERNENINFKNETEKFIAIDVKKCGQLKSLQPMELKILWKHINNIEMKYQILKAVDKKILIFKLREKFTKIIFKMEKSC